MLTKYSIHTCYAQTLKPRAIHRLPYPQDYLAWRDRVTMQRGSLIQHSFCKRCTEENTTKIYK